MIGVFASGVRRVSRLWLLLPLYLSSLVIGLVQGWPLWLAGGEALHNPFLAQLAGGSPDSVIDLVLAQSDRSVAQAGAWTLGSLVLACVSGLAYNLFCGGILSAYAGRRSFWQGSLHFVLSNSALGIILFVPIALSIGAGVGVATAAGPLAGVITAFVLLQLTNLWGEYGRAAAIARDRRNPFTALAIGTATIARNPGSLALGMLGLALSSAVMLAVLALLGPAGATLLGTAGLQVGILALIAVKQLRLAWALGYCERNQPQGAGTAVQTSYPTDIVHIS